MDEQWPLMSRDEESRRLLDAAWVSDQPEQPRTEATGYHGDGAFDLHYDPQCPRCTDQRDRLMPDPGFDEVYAAVLPEPTNCIECERFFGHPSFGPCTHRNGASSSTRPATLRKSMPPPSSPPSEKERQSD